MDDPDCSGVVVSADVDNSGGHLDYQYREGGLATGGGGEHLMNDSEWLRRAGRGDGNDSTGALGSFLLFGGNVNDLSYSKQLSQSTMSNSSANYTDDDYSYEYDPGVNTLPLGEVVPVTIIYSLTLLIGVVGNALVIFSIGRYRRLQNVTNVFLTSLASADLLLIMLCVPVKLAKWFTFTWTFGSFLCKVVHYMQNVSVICSILTLTAISLERYYAILYPMKAKYVCTTYRARRVTVLLWILSLSLATPIIFGQTHKEVGCRIKAYWCVKEWSKQWYSQLYETCMLFGVFLIPLSIMTFAYVCICREMWRVTAHRVTLRARRRDPPAFRDNTPYDDMLPADARSTGATCGVTLKHRRPRPIKDDAYTRKQVIKMLVTIIVLFALCWGPFLVDNVLVAFEHVDKYHYGHLKPMRQAFALMTYTNSCINPIVYAFMSKNFRHSFQTALMALLRRQSLKASKGPQRSGSFQTKITFSSLLPSSRRCSFRLEGEADQHAQHQQHRNSMAVPSFAVGPGAVSRQFLNVDHCNGSRVPHRKLSAPI